MKSTMHAVDLLRDLNPQPVDRDLREDASALWERLAVRLQDAATADLRSCSRRRLPRRTATVVAAAALIAAAAAGTVLAVGALNVDFLTSPKAPLPAVVQFNDLDIGAPVGMAPEAVANEAREIGTFQLGGVAHKLWVAPTAAGGYCTLWQGLGGGCDRLGTTPLDVSWVGGPGSSGKLIGSVNSKYSAEVELTLADGSKARPPITWVSSPIHAGFFVYEGAPVRSAAALDAGGAVVTREPTPQSAAPPIAPPPDAITSEKSLGVRDADAIVWRAPTRYHGTCAWLDFEGSSVPMAPCQPQGYDWNDGFTSRFYSTSDAVVFTGTAAGRYATIDVIYADGASSTITPVNHLFVLDIPSAHLTPGHEAVRIEAHGAAGELITSFSPSSNGCPEALPHSSACP